MYLEKLVLPNWEVEENIIHKRMIDNGGCLACGYIDNEYPCNIFPKIHLEEVDFERITIFYGNNGSGKSTLLNIIANKLDVKRIAPFNDSELFNDYFLKACKVRLGFDDEGIQYKNIPHDSRIISSDDVFDYMLTVRANNQEIAENIEHVKKEAFDELKFSKMVKMKGLEDKDYEKFRLQVMARKKRTSKRKFIKSVVGGEARLFSNGETVLNYFDNYLKENCIYLLDEPENSLSPKFQLDLLEKLTYYARYGGCQFIIATHSPFVLSIPKAKIYDLNSNPCTIKKWWELENTKAYFDFFNKHRNLFIKENKTS